MEFDESREKLPLKLLDEVDLLVVAHVVRCGALGVSQLMTARKVQ